MKPMRIFRAFVCLLAVAAPAGLALAQEAPRQVRVTAAVANVRAQPSPSGKVLFQLKKDETARLVDTTGDWHQIDAGGRRG